MPVTKFESYNASDVRSTIRINWLVPGCVAVLLLTVIAGVFQYSWINFASDAHRRQGREAMEVALRNFSGDFRDTLLQLPPFFRPPPDERNDVAFEPYMIEIARRWQSTSDRPQLLASISIGTQSDKGVVFRRLQTGDNQFKTEDWPNEFVVYRRVLEERLRLPGGQPPLFPNGFAFEFFQGRPVLIFPLVTGAPTPLNTRHDDEVVAIRTAAGAARLAAIAQARRPAGIDA